MQSKARYDFDIVALPVFGSSRSRWILPTLAEKILGSFKAPGSPELIEALFVRLLGLVYLIAFASLAPQILGLSGANGVAPAARLLAATHESIGARAYFVAPSLFWLYPADATLLLLCGAGCLAALMLVLNILRGPAAIACFVLYLSLVSIGEPFLSFQWDALLLEAGFLAIFSGAPWLVWAYRLLLFRLMFESGWVKLASHDPNWRNLHALRFHFWTQPLPNPIAYYVQRAPAGVLDALTALTLAIEFGAPFLLFTPRVPRRIGVGLLIALQLCIALTGNYAFFNLLTLALCLWGFDDHMLSPIRRRLTWRYPRREPSAAWRPFASVSVAVIIMLGLLQLLSALQPRALGIIGVPLFLQPFQIVNGYGLFAVMTTSRPEIVLEGSNDQIAWREYSFPYKPGNTHRELSWVAPYQPRLDWQMWFAALGDFQSSTWVGGLMYRLMTNEPSVARLLDRPPFEKPPRYMRALLYKYQFTTPAERARTGAVWQREYSGVWFGPVSLTGR